MYYLLFYKTVIFLIIFIVKNTCFMSNVLKKTTLSVLLNTTCLLFFHDY